MCLQSKVSPHEPTNFMLKLTQQPTKTALPLTLTDWLLSNFTISFSPESWTCFPSVLCHQPFSPVIPPSLQPSLTAMPQIGGTSPGSLSQSHHLPLKTGKMNRPLWVLGAGGRRVYVLGAWILEMNRGFQISDLPFTSYEAQGRKTSLLWASVSSYTKYKQYRYFVRIKSVNACKALRTVPDAQ